MYKLKQIPQDFIVEEIPKLNLSTIKQEPDKYIICKLTKTNLPQLLTIKILANELHVPLKHIGFAGTKDKVAITHQLISIKTTGNHQKIIENINSFTHENIKVTQLGFTNHPLSLGDLKGNKFSITIRKVTNEQINSIKEVIDKNKKSKNTNEFLYLNYFDEQRFARNNAKVGKLLIEKNWKSAAQEIQHFKVQEQLTKEPNTPLKAIKKLSKHEVMIYLHAYQSKLFNHTIKEFIESTTTKESQTKIPYSQGEFTFTNQKELQKIYQEDPHIKVPLPGFLKKQSKNKIINSIQKQILKEEKIKHTDFIIKQLSNLSPEGDVKDMVKVAKELKIISSGKDELNENLQKITLEFILEKGSYATMLIRQIVNQ